MSYGSGICDPGTANAASLCRSLAGRATEWRPRSRYYGLTGLPPIVETGTDSLALAVRITHGLAIPTYADGTGARVPAYIIEKHASRLVSATKDMRTLQRTFLIHGTDDPAACQDMGPQPLDAFEEDSSLTAEKRDCRWYASGEGSGEYKMCILVVDYRSRENGSGSDPLLEFQYGSESEHVTQAYDQLTNGPDELTLNRFKNNVNVTTDGIKGLEINSPIIDFSEEHIFTESQFNSSYRALLRDMVQKTNDAPFRDFGTEEVLFTGVTARKAANKWALTFNFRARRTETVRIRLTDARDGIEQDFEFFKLGWRYLWIESKIRYLNDAGDKKKTKYTYPHAASVAKVYDTTDFSALNIGTASIP